MIVETIKEQTLSERSSTDTTAKRAAAVRTDRGLLALVAAVGLLAYLPLLGCFGPTDPTDSFFLESGREMVESGQYLLPLNNYEPWLDKPILYFWMVAGAYNLFGVSPFVGRLPAALSAVALGLVIYHSTRGILRPRSAFLAACIFLCLPLASVVGHVCLTDMTLTLLISGTVLYLFRGWLDGSTKYLTIGYIFNALGLLCKGPIASILSAAALVLYFLIAGRSAGSVLRGIRDLKPLIGLSIALAINVPWYAAAIQATNGKFFEAFFLQQNFGRMMGTVNHQMPWWFYIPVFFGGFFPWCLLTVSVPALFRKAVLARREQKSPGFARESSTTELKPLPPKSRASGTELKTSKRVELFRLVLCWFATVMLLFSAIKTKLPTYILPAAPAFAILVVTQLEFGLRRSFRQLLLVGATVLIGLVAAAAVQPLLPSYLKTIVVDNWLPATAVLLLSAGSIFALIRGRKPVFLGTVTAALLLACTVFVPQGLKALHDSRQPGFNRLVRIARDAGATTAILSAEEPMMPYILHKPVYRLQSATAASNFVTTGKSPHYVVIPREMAARLDWFPGGSRLLDKDGKWLIYEVFAPR